MPKTVTRKSLWQLTTEELEAVCVTGTEQERRIAAAIIVNRQLQQRTSEEGDDARITG
jgi:hypothetical protein